MKRLIGFLTAAVIALGCVAPVMAAEENAAAMEKSLAAVKTKVEIPAEYTEFSSDSYNDDYRGSRFEFRWSDENDDKRIEISADDEGRITSYCIYDWTESADNPNPLAKNDKATIVSFAEEQLKKLAPEVFASDGGAVLSDYEFHRYNKNRYYLSFDRVWDGVEVGDDCAVVVVDEDENGTPILNSLGVNYDYDAEFEEKAEEEENAEAAYKRISPAVLEYSADYSGDEVSARLIYMNENKYMSVYTLDEVEPYKESWYGNQYAGGDDTAAESASDAGFTPQEQAELENVKGLKSKDDILNAVKGIDVFAVDADAEVKSSNIYKVYGEDDKYMIYIDTSDGKSIRADAKTGEIQSFYNNDYYGYYSTGAKEDEVKENVLSAEDAQAKTEQFLKDNLSAYGEYELYETRDEDGGAAFYYVRYINGIPFKEDYIAVFYSLTENRIVSYSYTHSDYEFPKPENVISADAAYDKQLEIAPLERIYVKDKDGKYRLCLRFSEDEYRLQINAADGEPISKRSGDWYSHEEYTDISGHWCEDKAKALERSGIAFNGSLLKPDEAINQADLIRVCAEIKLGMSGRYMKMDNTGLYLSTGSFMRPFYEDDSKSPVTREHACLYFARTLGLGEYIGDSMLFNAPFADGADIDDECAGAAALLAGAGVIGSGGSFRPKDNMTYAEALSVMYNIVDLGLN